MSLKTETNFKILLMIIGTVLGLFLSEIILRAIDWNPIKKREGFLQFGYSTGIPVFDEDGVFEEGKPAKIRLFQYDPVLFWKPIADTLLTNSQGFRGKKGCNIIKRENTIRIAFIGDSCTFLGNPVYPELLEEMLAKKLPNKKFELINASTPGYSSFQGKKLLASLLKYDPDMVVIYFGWNDHWLAQGGLTDEIQYSFIGGIKIFNLVKWLSMRFSEKSYRVPIEDYTANLKEIKKLLLKNNITPVFITAPSGFVAGQMPAWAYTFFKEIQQMDKNDIDRIPKVHNEYVDVVRKIAKDNGCLLVDAAKVFDSLRTDSYKFFRDDLIHLRLQGHTLMAELLFLTIQPKL